ncbi:MAG: cell division protein ZapA [Nitrospirota bacterium]
MGIVSTEVTILGQCYTVKGEADEEYIKTISRYVDNKMKELHTLNPRLTQLKLAILTAINITDELFKIKNEQELLDSILNEKTKDIFSLIEE